MEIKRNQYIEKLKIRKHNGMVKIITGTRRVGKSYLLFTLFKEHLLESLINSQHIIEINLENIDYLELRDPLKLYRYIKNQIVDNDMYYVLLDEIQLVKNFEDVLNGLLTIKNVDVYVTGSNAKYLSKDIITEFRGRGDEIRVYPLSFNEYYSVVGGDKRDALNNYMYYGGLPQILTMVTHEQKSSYLSNLFLKTYLTDIIKRNKITNTNEFEELIDILSSSIGSLTNPQKLSNTFQSEKKVNLSAMTINKYLEYLSDAFLVEKAVRYDIKGKKYINTPAKYYFVDLGLRNARMNFRERIDSHLFENLIYNELKIRGYSIDIGVVVINDKKDDKFLKKQLEIDFVCNKADERIYIQAVHTIPNDEKLETEKRSLLKLKDGFKKIIITLEEGVTHYNDDGILIMNIFDFLLNPEYKDL